MILSWLVYGLMVSTLLSAAGWLGERASRAQGWSGRWAWAGALAGTVGFPVWAWLAPSSPGSAVGALPGAYVMEALPPLVAQPSAAAGPTLEALLVLGWSAGSVLLLLWLALAAARLRVAEREWVATELEGVRVLVSERMGPAAMGLIRGRVVLPRWALALEAGLRRLMVLHEWEHVRARDPQLAVAGLLVCVLMPWNLPVWWQLRRLRLAIEMDCDARVLRHTGGDVGRYGALLLEVGERRARLALGLAETRSSLERRIRMMTERTTGRRTLRALALAGVAGLVLAVACETPGPTEVTDPEPRPVGLEDVQSMIRLRPAASPTGCAPAVYVDGEGIPAGGIADLTPESIERVDVFKAPGAPAQESGEACGVILVITKQATAEQRAAAEALKARIESDMRKRRTDGEPATTRQRRTAEEPGAAPTFTPMTERPQFRNVADVQRELMRHYPPLLRDAGIGGTTKVWFFISAEGLVEQVRVSRTSGYDALDEAALRVARQLEFTPARNRDRVVPVWIALDITFEVEGGEATPLPREPQETLEGAERAPRVAGELTKRAGAAGQEAPRFTPMTERPQLKNQAEVDALTGSLYPPLLRQAGIGGTVKTWLHIDQTGLVTRTAVHTTSGYRALDQAAQKVARQMVFTPARNRDRVVPVWVSLDITFDAKP